MDGWIKLYRQSQENELYFLEPFTKRQAWQDLILTANHKDGHICVRGNIIDIKRGQNGYAEDTLAKRRLWSRNKVRRYLNYLETIQQIEQQKSKVKSIITIINYNKYQGNDTTDDTTERHQTIQQTDTNKKENNVNNEKKENIENQKKEKLEQFEKFWNLYNKKISKPKSLKKFLSLGSGDIAKIFETLPTYLSTIRDKQFQKHPLTYLNSESRNDEYITGPTFIDEIDELAWYIDNNKSQEIYNKRGEEKYTRIKAQLKRFKMLGNKNGDELTKSTVYPMT